MPARAYPARAYIVVTVPAAQRLADSRSLGAVIDDVVKRRLTEPPISAAEEFSAVEFDAGPAFPDTGKPTVPRSLGDAVVAAHAERIGFLKQRIDALRSAGADARVLGDLRIRLQRAEAARRLAIARSDVATLPTSRRYAACDLARHAPAAPAIAIRRAPRSRPFRISTAPRTGERSRTILSRTISPTTLMASSVQPVATDATSLTRSTISQDRVVDRLAQARRSLTQARASLTDTTLQTAGLIHFPGSDTWSLSDTRTGMT